MHDFVIAVENGNLFIFIFGAKSACCRRVIEGVVRYESMDFINQFGTQRFRFEFADPPHRKIVVQNHSLAAILRRSTGPQHFLCNSASCCCAF